MFHPQIPKPKMPLQGMASYDPYTNSPPPSTKRVYNLPFVAGDSDGYVKCNNNNKKKKPGVLVQEGQRMNSFCLSFTGIKELHLSIWHMGSNRCIYSSEGHELIIFPSGRKWLAEKYPSIQFKKCLKDKF